MTKMRSKPLYLLDIGLLNKSREAKIKVLTAVTLLYGFSMTLTTLDTRHLQTKPSKYKGNE